MTLIPNDYEKGFNEVFETLRKEIDALKAENKELKEQLRLHSVSNCKNFDEIDGCECKECGYIWNPYETEHFNFTSCEMCGSDNVDADF